MATATIKLGNHLNNFTVKFDSDNNDTCRTQKQLESFINWVIATPEIVFFCNNPFHKDYENESHKCTVKIRYYNNKNILCSIDLTPTGIIKNHIVTGYCDMTKYGMVNKTVEEELAEIQLAIDHNRLLGVTNYHAGLQSVTIKSELECWGYTEVADFVLDGARETAKIDSGVHIIDVVCCQMGEVYNYLVSDNNNLVTPIDEKSLEALRKNIIIHVERK